MKKKRRKKEKKKKKMKKKKKKLKRLKLTKRHKQILHNQVLLCSIVLLLFAILFVTFYVPDMPIAYTTLPDVPSEEESSYQGEIYSVSTDPEKTMILEVITINLGVRNTVDQVNEYVLDIFISKDGKIKYENSFSFSLHADKEITFSPTFTPTAVGQHEIVVKLYDKYKTVLYDTKISDIDVKSDIGPFDLSLDVLSRTVKPNAKVPLIVSMKNIGIKGTDVKIAISMDCLEQEDIYKDFYVFVKGGGGIDKSSTITACDEEGLRHITAKLILFDHTFAESLNQVVINRTHYELEIEFPEHIKIKQGESKVFDVCMKNTAEIDINNLRMVIEDIPLEWTTTIPSVVARVKPEETIMFIVNISVPKDAIVIEYPIKIAIGSDETLVQKDFTLEIISGAFVGSGVVEVAPLIPERLQYRLIIIFIAGIVVIVALIIVFRKLMTKKFRGQKKKALKRVKDITR